MSKSKIEKNGILALRNFLSDSEVLEEFIAEGDKYPALDGDLILYRESGHNSRKDRILGRIPIQVKSSQRTPKAREDFQFEIADLRVYLSEGGALILRPIFRTVTDYSIYGKLLLPIHLREILSRTKKNQKKVTLELETISSVQRLEAYTKHYIDVRTPQEPIAFSQENLTRFDDSPIIVKTLTEEGADLFASLFSDKAQAYFQIQDGTLLLTDLQLGKIGQVVDQEVRVREKKFFDSYVVRRSKDNVAFELNSVLKISVSAVQQNHVLTIELDGNDSVSLADFEVALDFCEELQIEKSISFGEVTLEHFQDFPEDILSNFFSQAIRDTLLLCRIFRIDPQAITQKDFWANRKELNQLIPAMVYKQPFLIESQKEALVIRKRVFEVDVLLFLIPTAEGKFEANNYCTFKSSRPFYFSYKDVTAQASRFLYIPVVVKDIGTLSSILGPYISEMETDLIALFDSRLAEPYQYLMLILIKCYDQSGNKEFLRVAEEILQLLDSEEIGSFKITQVINRRQIDYRRRDLSDDEKEELISLRNAHSDNEELSICVNILLKNAGEFNSQYRRLNPKKQADLRGWPILNLVMSGDEK